MTIFKNWLSNSRDTKKAVAESPDLFLISDLEQHTDLCISNVRKIGRDSIRFVIFNEYDQRLLYDTETVVAINDRDLSDVPKSACGRFQFLRHKPDVSQIGKMVFGTLPTTLKTGSLKIHTLAHANSIMLSRVFFVPKCSKLNAPYNELKCMSSSFGSDSDCQSQHYATIRSLDTIRDDYRRFGQLKNSPADPPSKFTRVRNSSLQLESDDGILEDSRAFSPNQLSRARRRQMSLKGLADEGSAMRWGSRSRMSSCSSVYDNNEDMKQIGFAIIFNMEEKEFLFQHILQLEREIIKLEVEVYKATVTKNQFFFLVYSAYINFTNATCLLHNSLRLRTPVWLTLMDPTLQTEIAMRFCNTLAKLIEQFDKKDTRFFISSLLSALLMNHLAWVASVAPPDNCSSLDRSLLLGTSVVDCSRQPYNARMAQFMELCGSVGFGDRLAKTVVIGKNPRLICDVLFVLSYFIRCSSVEEKRCELFSPPPPSTQAVSPQSTMNSDPLDELINDQMEYNCCNEPRKDIYKEPTRVKRPSSSLSGSQYATSPIINSLRIHPSSSTSNTFHPSCLVINSSMDAEISEPPQKTRAVYSNCHDSTTPISSASNRRMELILDNEDVNFSGSELASTMNSPISTSLPQNIPCGISPTSTSSSQTASTCITNDLGRSLLAGVCESYSPHFVLSGVDLRVSDLEDTFNSIYEDVKHPTGEPCANQALSPSSSSSSALGNNHPTTSAASHNFMDSSSALPPAPRSSRMAHRNSNMTFTDSPRSQSSRKSAIHSLDGPSSAVVVVGDLSDWTVRVISAENCKVDDQLVNVPSDTVVSMLEQFLQLHKLHANPTFLISFVEDKLGGILAKSHTLVKLVTSGGDEKPTSPEPTKNEHLILNKPKDHVFRTPELPLNMTKLRNLSVAPVTHHVPFCSKLSSSIEEGQEDLDQSCMDQDRVKDEHTMSMQQVSTVIGCDCSDLRLIVNVAAIYSPPVLSSVG